MLGFLSQILQDQKCLIYWNHVVGTESLDWRETVKTDFKAASILTTIRAVHDYLLAYEPKFVHFLQAGISPLSLFQSKRHCARISHLTICLKQFCIGKRKARLVFPFGTLDRFACSIDMKQNLRHGSE